jgi:hypothetical protein
LHISELKLQERAPVPAQDDARENRLVDLFNLERPENRSRHGVDAILELDGRVHEFELKSITTTKGGLTTVRDFGPDHIAKWKTKHWIVALYTGDKLTDCKYASPEDIRPWIEDRWEYVRTDFMAAEIVPDCVTMEAMQTIVGAKDLYSLKDAQSVQKLQYSKADYAAAMDVKGGYSPEAMLKIYRDRVGYLLSRGSTLNNPKIPQKMVEGWPSIFKDHATQLKELVRTWAAKHPV